MNRWFVIDDLVSKNPTEKDFEGVEKHHIVELRQGTEEDLITETWWVSPVKSGKIISFTYSPSDIRMGWLSKNELRSIHFAKHGVSSKDIRWVKCYILPPSYFTENSVKLPANFGL